MQAAREKSASHFDMLQEDDSELNVMDFVETEYKPDKIGDKRKSSQRKSTLTNSNRVKSCQGVQNVLMSSVRYNQPHKKRQQRHTQRSNILPDKLNNTEVPQHYPYAACLKALCDQAGKVQNPIRNLFREKLFDTLRTVNVHYPYASLLEELHQNAKLQANCTPSRMEESHRDDRRNFEIANVMRDLNYPTRNNDFSRNTSISGEESHRAPYSGMLMTFVIQQQIQEYSDDQHKQHEPNFESSCRVGEILRAQMPVLDKLDSPPHELQSSAILQKLAFSAQEVNVGKDNPSEKSPEELVLEWSSTESSQCEEDDLEWRPPHWQAKMVTSIVSATSKRKSRRKTKKKDMAVFSYPSGSQDCVPNVQTTSCSRSYSNAESESGCVTPPKSSPQLLQLSVGCDDKDIIQRRKNRRISKRSKPSKRKGKQKVVRKREKDNQSWQNSVHNERVPSHLTKEKHIELACRNEPQSLLKEYLLKPTEEILPVKNCDIPKGNTGFLFSRLLQNFKNLAESGKSKVISKKDREDGERQSILRGMLVAGNSSASELLSKSVREEEIITDDVSFSRSLDGVSSPLHHYNSHSPLYKRDGPLCEVKCEEDIKVECEEVFCKIECDEEVFECQVCYLQFSSGLDLSNHQILFHCTDDPISTEGRKLVPCGVDGLQEGGVSQGKLQA